MKNEPIRHSPAGGINCQLNGLNPEAYLKEILTRIANGHPINRIAELMPWRIAAPSPAPSP